MGEVIPFPQTPIIPFQKSDNESTEINRSNQSIQNNVIDITTLRKEQNISERRRARRVIFSHLISVHVMLPGWGLTSAVIRDLDEGGLSFEMDSFFGSFAKGDMVELRFYLNGKTYFKRNEKDIIPIYEDITPVFLIRKVMDDITLTDVLY